MAICFFPFWLFSATCPKEDSLKINHLADSAFKIQSSNSDLSWLLAEQALEVAEIRDCKFGKATVYSLIGNLFKEEGELDSALHYYIKSIHIRERQHDSSKLSASNAAIGSIYIELGECQVALGYLDKAMELLPKWEKQEKFARLKINIGACLFCLGENELALKNCEEAAQLCPIDDYYLRFRIGELKGNIYYELEQDSKAEEQFIETINKLGQHIKSIEKANLYNSLGAVQYGLDKIDAAKNSFLQCLNMAQLSNQHEVYNLALENLSYCYEDLDKLDSAYFCRQLHDSSQQVFFNNRLNSETQKLKVAFETEQKEKEIERLKIVEQVQQANLNLLFMTITGLGLLLVIVVAVFLLIRQRQKTKLLLKDQKVKALIREKELIAINAMLEGQEKERARIARDLHDRLGGLLSTIKLHFNNLEKSIDSNQSENIDHYKKTYAMLDEAVAEVRRISHDMVNGVLLQFGLGVALQELATSIEANQDLKFKIIQLGLDQRLDIKQEVQLYRICQELIVNTIKHANAKSISIRIKKANNTISFNYQDNGQGFNTQQGKKGIGLNNVSLRVSQLKGTLSISSEPNKGVNVNIEFPTTENTEYND